MTNIWAFLNQTLSVSLIAAILLIVKYLLNDKLSPRWQYGICGILALRILFPVQIGKGIYAQIQIWLEVLKANLEKGIDSAYTEIYIPAKANHVLPHIISVPNSITDWLLVIYAVGFVMMLLWYLISYFRLRILLRKGSEVSPELYQKIESITKKYGLKSCRAVMVKGLSSAFVCGGFHPILTLPAGKELDEKILLHELLHLKYHDELQSMGWCVLRCLHWCNPFLQYVFNRIENDMESLCDQRVLERLEGEERREYGMILLDMANEKYARVPGTSSISNGGKNISRRIAAIVRFKKYPRGMALVSICIALVLLSPGLMETTNANGYQYQSRDYQPQKEQEFEKAMALARINRCTTVAGALDTYAKGLMFEHGIYIATVSPFSEHQRLVEQMLNYDGPSATMYRLDSGIEFDTLLKNDYRIYNVEKIEENLYKAYLVFSVYGWHDSLYNSVIVPVEVYYEDAWLVKECGERILSIQDIDGMMHAGSGIPSLATYEAVGETGTVTISVINYCYIDHNYTNSTGFWMGTSFDDTLKLNAEFQSGYIWDSARYEYSEDADGNVPKYSIGMKYIGLDSLDEKVEFPDVMLSGNGGGSDSDGFGWANHYIDDGKKYLETGGGRGETDEAFELKIPEGFQVELYWDLELVEEVTAKRVENAAPALARYPEIYGELSQTSVYMSEDKKNAFKEEKDAEYQLNKEFGSIQKISDTELDEMVENYLFSDNLTYDESVEMDEMLASYGIYKFETTNSTQPDVYMPYTKVLYPQIFYNANDGTWIVTCGGYCDGDGDGITKKILPGDVGERETFGVRFTEITGSYDSLVVRATANLTDMEKTQKEETQNRSDGDGASGFLFELQDYIYDASPFDGQENYVGYRWYGACTYGPGFEKLGGNVTAIYQHTE